MERSGRVGRSEGRTWLKELLEVKMDDLLGRRQSAGRRVVDAVPDYRSGHGPSRRPILSAGIVTIRQLKVWGLAYSGS